MERAGRFRVIAYDKASYQLQRYHGEGGTISRRRDEHTYIPLQRYHGEGGTLLSAAPLIRAAWLQRYHGEGGTNI